MSHPQIQMRKIPLNIENINANKVKVTEPELKFIGAYFNIDIDTTLDWMRGHSGFIKEIRPTIAVKIDGRKTIGYCGDYLRGNIPSLNKFQNVPFRYVNDKLYINQDFDKIIEEVKNAAEQR